MSRLDPPKVLVDASALRALVDPDHPGYDDIVAVYRDLVEQYRREQVLLVAVDDHLKPLDLGGSPADWQWLRWWLVRPRAGVLAPIDPLRVGFQHRRAAERLSGAGVPLDVALTLVMCRREHVARVLTLDDRLDGYGLDLVPLTTSTVPAE